MKLYSIIGFSLLLLFSAAVVKKETSNATPACINSKWTSYVVLEEAREGENMYSIPEKNFLKGEVAEVEQLFGFHYRYWTGLELDVPCSKKIKTTDITLEWRCKSNVSLGLYESDMGASLLGEKDTATINCLGANRPPYFVFRYGTLKENNVPELLINPGEWATYSLGIAANKMSFSKNGIVKKTISGEQSLGDLKKIYIHFKGSGKVDWVKLYGSGKLLLQEDFNSTGKSSPLWKN